MQMVYNVPAHLIMSDIALEHTRMSLNIPQPSRTFQNNSVPIRRPQYCPRRSEIPENLQKPIKATQNPREGLREHQKIPERKKKREIHEESFRTTQK